MIHLDDLVEAKGSTQKQPREIRMLVKLVGAYRIEQAELHKTVMTWRQAATKFFRQEYNLRFERNYHNHKSYHQLRTEVLG